MRMLAALAIYVSLNASAMAEDQNSINEKWIAIHADGIEADQHQRYDEAIDYFRQCWSSASNFEERGIAANDLGQAYRQAKRPKEAMDWLGKAYSIWRENPPVGRFLVIATSSLAELYRDSGDYAHAETFLREALAVPGDTLDSADAIRNNLADLLREEGRDAEARQFFSATLGRTGISWQQQVNALAGLADLDRHAGNRVASEAEWNQVQEIARSHADRVSEGIALRGLGSLWLSAGNSARAEPLFRDALAILETTPNKKPEDMAIVLFNLAQLYRALNKLALAEDAWSRALQLYREAFGELHPQVAEVEEMLAEVYAKRGEPKLALSYASEALDSMKCLFGENAMPTAVAFANRATVKQLTGDLDGALKDYQRAVGIMRENPRNELLEKNVIEKYAGLLKATHHGKQAKTEVSMLTAVQ